MKTEGGTCLLDLGDQRLRGEVAPPSHLCPQGPRRQPGAIGPQHTALRFHLLALLNLPLEKIKGKEPGIGDGMNYPEDQTQDLAESCIRSTSSIHRAAAKVATRDIP